jgi:hypothetical protein
LAAEVVPRVGQWAKQWQVVVEEEEEEEEKEAERLIFR